MVKVVALKVKSAGMAPVPVSGSTLTTSMVSAVVAMSRVAVTVLVSPSSMLESGFTISVTVGAPLRLRPASGEEEGRTR